LVITNPVATAAARRLTHIFTFDVAEWVIKSGLS
jgi:hypothetical protein